MLVTLPVKSIRPSPSNPRKTFDQVAIDELAQSFREVGMLEPIMVRPLPKAQRNGITHELVFGERRWRAAPLANLKTIECIERELNDKQVLEIQIIENDKRSDVHPLEQADGYRRLHEDHGYTVEDLAVKVGRSPSFIHQRMKLCALVPEARTAYLQEKILPSVAVMLARIPHEDLQRRALEAVVPRKRWKEDPEPGPLTVAEAAAIIRDDFMLRLDRAPFDRADAALVPRAGACTNCPKRTGSQAELFADVESPDLCTDSKCHKEKVDAHWLVLQAKAKEEKRPVLTEQQSKKLFNTHRNFRGEATLNYDAGFVKADEKVYAGGKEQSVKKILGGKDAPPTVLARAPDGQIVELFDKKTVEEAKRKLDRTERAPHTQMSGQAKKARLEKEVERRESNAVIAAIVAKASKVQLRDDHLRLLVECFSVDWRIEEVAKRRGFETKGTGGYRRFSEAVVEASAQLAGGELVALLVEMALRIANLDEMLERAEQLYKIDGKAIAAEARAEAKAEHQARKAKAKKPAAKPASKPAAKKPAAAKKPSKKK